MSEYQVNSKYNGKEWQVDNSAGPYDFVSDEMKDAGGPNPVEYLAGAVNSCITISAAMIIKVHHLDVKNFKIENNLITVKKTKSLSVVDKMRLNISFDSQMTSAEKDEFIAHVLHVSTVYQSIKDSIRIEVEY